MAILPTPNKDFHSTHLTIYSDIVKAAHLRPLSKKEIECKSNPPVVWNNVVATHNMQDSKQPSSDFIVSTQKHL